MWNFYDDITAYEEEGILEKKTLYEEFCPVVKQHPEKTAVVDSQGSLSYEQLLEQVDLYSEFFTALGLERGQNVILQMPNKNLFVVVLFALLKIGVKPAMMLPAQRSTDVRNVANQIGAVAYLSVTDYMGFDYTEVIEPIEKDIPTLQYILLEGLGESPAYPPKWKDLTRLTLRKKPQKLAEYRDDALYLLSGGTTGVPKIIPKMQEAYACNARAVASRCGFDGTDVYMAILPVSHDLALANPGILGALLTGGTAVLCETPGFDEAFSLIEEHGVTITTLVPAIIRIWAEVLEWYEGDFSSMRQLFVGAARIDRRDLETLEEKLGVSILQGYGLGEGITCVTRPEDSREVIYATQGTPVSEGDRMQIIDSEGWVLERGQVGELIEKGPYTFRGYLNNEALNRTCFTEDGYFKTGDKAMIREDGNLVILGRVVEQINRAGENVIPSEIEEVLARHPHISGACVFGMPDEQLGECTVACLICDCPLSRPDLCRFMESQGMAAFKYPDRIVYTDRFVYKNIGKVDKKTMKKMLEGGELEYAG